MLDPMVAPEQSNEPSPASDRSHAAEGPAAASADSGNNSVVGDLLGVVPRWVGRTRSQAEFARMFAALLPCIGALVTTRHDQPGPGVPEHEHVDVLSVLGSDLEDRPGGRDSTVAERSDETSGPGEAPAPEAAPVADAPLTPPDEAGPVTTDPVTTGPATVGAAPSEAELPIQDYDSLAASQVVPRLATLSDGDLRSVQRYETANRRRQTILNRVAQLLAG